MSEHVIKIPYGIIGGVGEWLEKQSISYNITYPNGDADYVYFVVFSPRDELAIRIKWNTK